MKSFTPVANPKLNPAPKSDVTSPAPVSSCKFISAHGLYASKIEMGNDTMILVTEGPIEVGKHYVASFNNPAVMARFRPDDHGWNEATNYINSKV